MGNEKYEVASDNVVGRLYNLVFELKNSNGDTKQALTNVFSIKDTDINQIYICYGNLYKMCLIGIEEIRSLNLKNSIKYIDILNNVIEGLSKISFDFEPGTVDTGMQVFNNYFDNIVMSKLESCADLLSEYSKENNCDNEKLQELINEIENIEKDVVEINFNVEFKKILISQLNNVRESLMNYRMFGNEGVIKSIYSTSGAVMFNMKNIDDANKKSVIRKVMDTLNKMNNIFNCANKGINLIEYIKDNLIG